MPSEPIMEVLAPGLQTSLQDIGRNGFGRYGVAASGALDSFSLRIGNLLVGNPENAAGLETMLLGLRVRALRDIAVAVTGADLQPHCDGKPIAGWCAQVLLKGQELSFKGPQSGFRAYLAVGGGLNVPPVMDSKATNLPAGFGGLEGRALRAKDVLSAERTDAHLGTAGRCLKTGDIPVYPGKWTLRIIWGPQDDQFAAAGRAVFLEREPAFTVSPQSDRTGIRLSGPRIEPRPDVSGSIISEGVIAGAIQVPGDGQPIIILNETVTGGYRKIATVIGADLPLLGQIKPGDGVCFEAVSLAVADAALGEVEAKIAQLRERFTE